jgi:Fe-S cluster assembly iron-binding protein IscA
MNFKFNSNAKEALEELIKNSSENYIRIKVFYGCGRPAYELYCDFKSDEDVEEVIEGINFIVNKRDVRACNNLEIKYDKEVYNKGFYIKDLD